MNLQELKNRKPDELVAMAEQLGIEEASSKRVQELIYEILQKLVENNEIIEADGVLQILTDGFGFLRSPKYNYLPGPDD
ncbi:Rho termination factor N-terminal domain-containing protein, partial [bacterium]|nr:Rho termination factor N-terminal domain-containing protein [bacterium]